MTERQLVDIHHFMIKTIEASGGRIDKAYHCPELAEMNPPCRKPNPGMAFQAKTDFPEIDFSKSVMVGDSMSDMEFGKRLGMLTVFIKGKEEEDLKAEWMDYRFESLYDFSKYLEQL